MTPKPDLNYIDLFAGCGGLSLGLHNAGWKGLFAIEKSPFAFETLEHNLIKKLDHFAWPDWLPQTPHDINEVLQNYKDSLVALRNKVDLIAGGPPCQGFSTAGLRQEDDKRNGLIKSYINFIRLVQPKIIFFENVRGFTQKFENNRTKGKKYSEYVTNCLRLSGKTYIGYNVVSQLVDFSEYGVPQKRTRFILVGIRKDIDTIVTDNKSVNFFTQLKNSKEKFLISKELSLNHSLEEAISDLLMKNGKEQCPDSKGFYAGVYAPPKSNYQIFLKKGLQISKPTVDSHRFANHSLSTDSLFELLLEKARKGKKIVGDERTQFNLKKRGITILHPKQQAPTLTSHPDDYVHYCEPRILTVREYARIQTFPDWYEFRRKYTTGGLLRKVEVPRYTQIANAIPPLFGEQAGLGLQEFLK